MITIFGRVGTPPFTALEDTRLGPVMPQNNFELPIPLVSLGGRGPGTSLMAYYNSNVWGYYFDPGLNGTVYVFDPIQGWPSPGFSLGFGRIVYYNSDGVNCSYMLIDPNGTRHAPGVGSTTGANTLQTTDGSHMTYVGNLFGGTLYYQDGTKMTISVVNNRRLPTQITDSNGNYIQIAYKTGSNAIDRMTILIHVVQEPERTVSFALVVRYLHTYDAYSRSIGSHSHIT